MTRWRVNVGVNGKVVNVSVAHKHMKLAVKADLDWLFKRKPMFGIKGESSQVELQLLEMLRAEERAERYGIEVPWRSEDWHGINVPKDAKDITHEVDNSAKMQSRTTGRTRRTTKGEK